MTAARFAAGLVAACLSLPGAASAAEQDYPSKPIRLVTSEAGGSTDIVARLIANGLTEDMGRRIVVDNRRDFIAAATVSSALKSANTFSAPAPSTPLVMVVNFSRN